IDAGPVGLVAALTLLQNGISVCIIDNLVATPYPRVGQCSAGTWPRSLELYNFLGISEVNSLGTPAPVMRGYKPGMLEVLKDSLMVPHIEPTPAIPFLLDVVLRRHLEKFSCSNGISEIFDTESIIGADGIVRKQLGLTFSGEIRKDTRIVTGDISLTRWPR
ncbi:uncharacterized protein F5891DRAFT_995890, partial [Suillus fuscotomentosus]